MVNAIIDAGGGLRNIYTAGVFDRCLDDNVYFDLCIGVSAGAANISTFLAGQRDRTYRFFHDYSQRKEYMSFGNFIKKGSYLDLDYIYSTLTNSDGEDPLDYPEIEKYKGQFLIVATEAKTGKAHYFTKEDLSQDNYRVINASCAIPVVCKPVSINGTEYMDGGVAVPVPLEKALEMGADKIVFALSKPKDFRRDNSRNEFLVKLIRRKYPETAKVLLESNAEYDRLLDKAIELEKEGRVLIVSPDDTCGVDTLTKDKEKLHALYEKGYRDAEKIKEFLCR
ncbi:MAG: patatin family protein [Ruminococcaceae bacterium]|nr:patatin family protein [Oscillospiraceae bacterium]